MQELSEYLFAPTPFNIFLWVTLGTVSVIGYVLGSIGLYTLAKRRSVRFYSLAWVPIFGAWILGVLSDRHEKSTQYSTKNRNVSFIGSVVMDGSPGSYANEYIAMPNKSFSARHALLFASIVWVIFSFLPIILIENYLYFIGSVPIFNIFICVAFYQLLRSCTPRWTVPIIFISAIFPFMPGYFMFAIRNSEPSLSEQGEDYIPSPQEQHAC